MFEELLGRLISGTVWGLGAGIALRVVSSGEGGGRQVVKGVMKAYVTAADRLREAAAEARESAEDLYAEVKTERRGAVAVPAVAASDAGARRPSPRRARGPAGRTDGAATRRTRGTRARATQTAAEGTAETATQTA